MTWIDHLEPGSPEVQQGKGRNNPQKSRPSKRRGLITRQEARALGPISGNIMDPRRRSPRRQPPTTPSKATKERPQTLDGVDEETPRAATSTGSAGILPDHTTMSMVVHLPPPVYNGPDPLAERDSSPSRSSLSSSARSTSPTKQLADLRMAERPTLYKTLNGKVARKAGGVLAKYPDLVAVSRGKAVIPRSLKVSTLLNDPSGRALTRTKSENRGRKPRQIRLATS